MVIDQRRDIYEDSYYIKLNDLVSVDSNVEDANYLSYLFITLRLRLQLFCLDWKFISIGLLHEVVEKFSIRTN